MSKRIHMAAQCNQHGGVSAVCFAKPRPINLKLATWTNRREAVTCKGCLAMLSLSSPPQRQEGERE